jgi:hypothetical protein
MIENFSDLQIISLVYTNGINILKYIKTKVEENNF